VVLDALYRAIRGESGSRYYDNTIRHTRCVCVTYEDGMHVDLTPAVLVAQREPRTSVIFHSKPEDPSEPKLGLLANPWGLAEWFKGMTPLDADFAKMFEGRAIAHDRAPGEPVPDQEPVQGCLHSEPGNHDPTSESPPSAEMRSHDASRIAMPDSLAYRS
jgi:hypothetical protein